MRVLLALGNRILSDSLKDTLIQCNCSHECRKVDTIIPGNGFPPDIHKKHDVIVTDYLTMGRLPEACFDASKILIMDYGMERETIAALFLTERISGVVHASSDVSMLCKAIKAVERGEVWIDNQTIKSLITSSISRKVKGHPKLTEREIAIVKLLKEGYRNKELATILCISEQTVKSHINRIFRKMNVSSRSELLKKFVASEN